MKIFSIGSAILLVVVGSYFLWRQPVAEAPIEPTVLSTSPSTNITATSTSETEDIAEKNLTIIYTDRGFTPAVLEVRVGDTVTFKNESSRDVWVASDDHPKHLLYPEFDAQRGVVPGSEYTFTFEKLGSWKYHDHLKASLGGSIIVK